MRSVAHALPTPRNVVPDAIPSWGGYWTAITAMVLIMLLAFLAANGQLTAWLNLLVFAPPSSVQPTGATGLASNPAYAAIDHSKDTAADKVIDTFRFSDYMLPFGNNGIFRNLVSPQSPQKTVP